MRDELGRGREVLRHADVKLMRPAGKPDPTAAPESLRLLQLGEADQFSVERPRSALASDRRGDLHVVQPDYLHASTVAHANGPSENLRDQLNMLVQAEKTSFTRSLRHREGGVL